MAYLPRIVAATLVALTAAAGFSPAALGSDKQWTSYGALPGDAPVFGLAISPVQTGTVYAATIGASLAQTDDGVTWHEVSPTLPRRIWKISIDPAPDTLGFEPMYAGSAGEGFWKSLDGGKTWAQMDTGLTGQGALNVRSIALGVHLIVIGTSNGVFKSSDGGAQWQPAGLQGYDISSVAFTQYGLAGSTPTALAGVDGLKSPGARLLSSSGLAGKWTPVQQGVPTDMVVSSIASGPVPSGANARPVWVVGSAGVIKSDDGGSTWAQLAGLPNPLGFDAVATSDADPNVAYVVSDGSGGAGQPGGGVWVTVDRGGTWAQLATGLTEHAVTAVAVGRDSPVTSIVATYAPDARSVKLWQYRDAGVAPTGTPEDGFCPEASCATGNISLPVAVHGSPESGAPLVNPCPTPSPTPSRKPSPRASGASPSPSPATSPAPAAASASATASPSPSGPPAPNPCVTPSPTSRPPAGGDLPPWIALGGVGLLLVILVGRLALFRR